jgi:hypothetical protein
MASNFQKRKEKFNHNISLPLRVFFVANFHHSLKNVFEKKYSITNPLFLKAKNCQSLID